jgi:hypothetical protein
MIETEVNRSAQRFAFVPPDSIWSSNLIADKSLRIGKSEGCQRMRGNGCCR